MFGKMRSRVTPSTVIATLALVFAITGGAYAAKRYLITSKAQISPKVLEQLQAKAGATGPTGPTGPAGLAGARGETGPAGEKGAAGSPGANGKDGADGESVTNQEFVGEAGECTEGGTELKVGTGAPTYLCDGEEGTNGTNGKNGATGPQGPTGPEGNIKKTLASGETETGVWAAATGKAGKILGAAKGALAGISFTIPLGEEPQVHVVGEGKNGEEGKGCPATSKAANPEAEPGNLCIFVSSQEGVAGITPTSPESGVEGAGRMGSVLYLVTTGSELHVAGTWAVTAK